MRNYYSGKEPMGSGLPLVYLYLSATEGVKEMAKAVISAKVDAELRDELDKVANQLGISRNRLIIESVEQMIFTVDTEHVEITPRINRRRI